MEVDPSHPPMIQQWIQDQQQQQQQQGSLRVHWEASYKDFCGRDRFVKLSLH
jgi:hypothetical protein